MWRHGYMRIRFNVWRILCPLVNLKPLFGVFGKRWGGSGGGLRKSPPPLPRKKKPPPARRWRETKGTNTQASKQPARRGMDSQTGVFCLSSIHSPLLSSQTPFSPLPFPGAFLPPDLPCIANPGFVRCFPFASVGIC